MKRTSGFLALLLSAILLSGCNGNTGATSVKAPEQHTVKHAVAPENEPNNQAAPETPDTAEAVPEPADTTVPETVESPEAYAPGALWAANYLPTILDSKNTVTISVTFYDSEGSVDSSETYRFGKEGEFITMDHEYTAGSGDSSVDCKETAFPDPCARYYWDGTVKMLTCYPSWLYNDMIWDSVLPQKGSETVTQIADADGLKAVHTKEDPAEGGYSETVYYVTPGTVLFDHMEQSFFDGSGKLLGKAAYKWSYDEPQPAHALEPKGLITDVDGGCALKLVIKDGNYSEEQNFTVAKDAVVSFGIAGVKGMYSDEACQTPVDSIDVTGDSEEVYVLLS